MAQVLVVAEVADGVVRKTTFELLTIARRLGEPAAVVFTDSAGASDAAALAPALAEYGAVTVYLAQADGVFDHLVVGKAEALAAVVATAARAPAGSPPSCSGRPPRARRSPPDSRSPSRAA